eukprot:2480087-Amphidinium_carterae.6
MPFGSYRHPCASASVLGDGTGCAPLEPGGVFRQGGMHSLSPEMVLLEEDRVWQLLSLLPS